MTDKKFTFQLRPSWVEMLSRYHTPDMTTGAAVLKKLIMRGMIYTEIIDNNLSREEATAKVMGALT